MKQNLENFKKAFPFGLGLFLFFGQTLFFTYLLIAQENKTNQLLFKHHELISLISKKLEIHDMQINTNHTALHLQISEAKHKLDLAEYKSISTMSSGLYNGDNTILLVLTSKPVLILLCLVGAYYGFSYLTGIEAVNNNVKTLSTEVNQKISNLNQNLSTEIKTNYNEINHNIGAVNTNLIEVNNSVSKLGQEINYSVAKSKDDVIDQILKFFNYKKTGGGSDDGGQMFETILQQVDGSNLQVPSAIEQTANQITIAELSALADTVISSFS